MDLLDAVGPIMKLENSLRYFCIILVLILGCFTQSFAEKRVLVVHSYHAASQWVRDINSALQSQLKATDIAYRIFYLDTARNSDPSWKLEAARRARQIIDTFAPQVVIAIDDNAQAYVTRNFAGNSPIQFVFAGVNADPEFYGFPVSNVTGILERTYPEQVMTLLKRITTSDVNIVWISDDSATANLVLRRVREKAESDRLPLPVKAYLQPVTFDQWKAAIRQVEADPTIGAYLIPLYHTVKTRVDGQSMSPSAVMEWTVAHTSKPIVGLWPFSIDDGAVCAVVVSPVEHGRVAGLMAKQILAGKKADDLPVLVNEDGIVIVNTLAASKLGIEVPFEALRFADKVVD